MPNDIFPQATSQPIGVGGEWKSPYQWAAKLAPSDQLVSYKNALLWLEGESFGSEAELVDKIKRVIAFQNNQDSSPPETAPTEGEWQSTRRRGGKKSSAPKARWTLAQLASAIVDAAIDAMKRTFDYKGPSLRISDVYSDFDKNEFTYPNLIRAVRAEITARPIPAKQFGVPASARYWAETSAGKGKNFNFKVQKKDTSKPNGWSAAAQIHVLWE